MSRRGWSLKDDRITCLRCLTVFLDVAPIPALTVRDVDIALVMHEQDCVAVTGLLYPPTLTGGRKTASALLVTAAVFWLVAR